MDIHKTEIDGVQLVSFTSSSDERGTFTRVFCADSLLAANIPFQIKQVSVSQNIHKHTLRGIHYQLEPYSEGKLVRCSRGKIWDVAVDMRKSSITFKKWQGFILDSRESLMLFLSPGIAHGFITMEDDCEITYLINENYNSDFSTGLRFDDPAIAIEWPSPPKIISQKDLSYSFIN